MNMKRTALNWLRGAEYDIKTAESLLRGRRYVYVIFMCHLAVEKTLKAIVAETSTTPPPRTHNLYRLLELGRIQLPEVHETVVAQLNTMSTATRYPEDMATLEAEVTRKVAQTYLIQTQELLTWLRADDRLQPSSDATSPPSKAEGSPSSG
jgi:HEPN domain-containing protein